MAKLASTFCALGALTVASALAQTSPTAAPTISPIAPPGATIQSVSPSTPASTPATATPAPIEPPIQFPAPALRSDATDVAPVTSSLPGASMVSGAPAIDPNASRVFEFQKDEIGLVLRTLARQANLNIVVSDKVTTAGGTVETRLVNMTARQALETIVRSKGLVIDELNNVTYIKTQEEKSKEPTKSASHTLSFAAAKDVLPLLQTQLLSGSPPQFDQRTNTVFYRELESNMDMIQLFLVAIDRPTQQVMIEARLVEVTANPRQSYGINWSGVVGGSTNPQTLRYGGSTISSTDAAGVVTPPQVITDPETGRLTPQDLLRPGNSLRGLRDSLAGQVAILSIPQMSLTMRLLNEDADSEFLANPRVVTANNTKAEIKITRAQPVPQLNFNEQTAQAVFSGFQDKEFGNTLEVTPSINKDDFISLLVKPEISNKVGDAAFTFGGATVLSPIIDKRTLNSNVLIKSGDTLAIGGLLQDEVSKGRTKVPVLGDIPLVGYLFQEKTSQRLKRNLLVFVTPTVIKQGYGTGLEDQVSGLNHVGEEFADPNGWRNNARGASRLVPTSHRQVAADAPKPGVARAPKKVNYRVTTETRDK